jgi:tRNA threonylcarbamoyl adenosine modification protein (Sua5/YciO/YrdC/YwlC family)
MPRIVKWSPENAADVIEQAVTALREGKLVAVPTETVYGLAAALLPAAVDRLRTQKGRPEGKPLAVAVRSSTEAQDWVPNISPLGRRLARRCWPGPVTLVFENVTSGPIENLPQALRGQISPAGSIGLRVSNHPALARILEHLGGPLVLTSANRAGEPPATTAEDAVAALGDDVGLVIDAGASLHGQASTVVSVGTDFWKMLREGVVPEAQIEQMAARTILLVCTGNTCRSPIAEGLCKRLLADRIECGIDELPSRGIRVLSAGVNGMIGIPATIEAVEVARAYGVDLEGHESRPVTAALLAGADHVLVMTQGHQRMLAAHFPACGPEPELLAGAGNDIDDPVGCALDVYRQCAAEIWVHLERRVATLEW